MPENEFAEDLAVLGLQEGDGPEAIRKAYTELKSLYAEGSLATYTLLDEAERRDFLDRIEEAYCRVTEGNSATPGAPNEEPPPEKLGASLPEENLQAPPSRKFESNPGFFLKETRERVGMSLREIADQTKIGVRRLQHIEDERFDQLPAPVFLRGFVIQFAETLGIADPEEVAQSYLGKLNEIE